MTLKNVLAHFECDHCRKDFRVVMERGDPIPDGWDLDDLATDAVRGGELHFGPGQTITFATPSVTEAGEHLCPACTEIEDAKHGDAAGALGTEAEGRNTAGGPVHEGPASRSGATPILANIDPLPTETEGRRG